MKLFEKIIIIRLIRVGEFFSGNTFQGIQNGFPGYENSSFGEKSDFRQ